MVLIYFAKEAGENHRPWQRRHRRHLRLVRPAAGDAARRALIGATPFANLFLNTGHGTLGRTMACGAAPVLGDMVPGRRPEISLDGLQTDRSKRGALAA